MQGLYLRFYVPERRRVHGVLAYEWLLQQGQHLGLPGGSAFRAIAGFGRDRQLHEAHFFELAGDLPVEVGFALSEAQAQQLLAHLAGEPLPLFYVSQPVEMGWLGGTP